MKKIYNCYITFIYKKKKEIKKYLILNPFIYSSFHLLSSISEKYLSNSLLKQLKYLIDSLIFTLI